MELKQYIGKLQKVADNPDKIVERIINEHKGYIGSLWKRNRYNYGFDPSLGEYADSTKRQKERKGRKTQPFSLFNEGEWYDTLQPFYNSQKITLQMYSTRPRLDVRGKNVNYILISKYGWEIFDFTDEETNFVVKNIVDVAFEEALSLKGDLKIPGY